MAVLTMMVVGMHVRRAIGMEMRMLVLIVSMGAGFVAMAMMAMCRTVFMHVPVGVVRVIVGSNGFALYARLADGTSTSGTHCSAPPVSCFATWSLNRPRVL
jgi:hypothetical protein